MFVVLHHRRRFVVSKSPAKIKQMVKAKRREEMKREDATRGRGAECRARESGDLGVLKAVGIDFSCFDGDLVLSCRGISLFFGDLVLELDGVISGR